MTFLDSRLPSLEDGYYLYYLQNSGRKHIYTFELTGEDVYILRTMFQEGGMVKIITHSGTYKRMMLNQERTGVIFHLTDEEYLLEMSEEL